MHNAKNPPCFQVRIETVGSPPVYFLDLNLDSLLRDILIPFHTESTIFLRGRETSVDKIWTIKIAITDERVLPRLKSWHEKLTSKPAFSRDKFFRETQLFDIEYDVTNALVRQFRESTEWQKIKELLEEESKLRQEQASLAVSAKDDENISNRRKEILSELTYLAGVFISGYTKFQQ